MTEGVGVSHRYSKDGGVLRLAGPLFRAIVRRRYNTLVAEDPVEAQSLVLKRLVRKAAGTRFGRDHGFAGIATVADYQRQVPLRRYDDFWREYWQPTFPIARDCTWPGLAPFYSMSSGTSTGVNKYIPTTHALIRTNAALMRDVLTHHAMARPGGRALRGKTFILGGSTQLTPEAPGVQSGDLSGIELATLGWPINRWIFPPLALSGIADYETKIDSIAKASLGEDIRVIIGPPNWLLVYFDRLLRLKPGASRLIDVYPNLELVVHGGMAFAPFRARFRRLLAGSAAETREIYAASEGFFAVADRGDGQGLRLVVDSGIFYEFIPLDELGSPKPTRHWIGNAETGVDYALAISNPAGAWSYVLGDTVRLIDKRPARLFVTGRTSYVLTPFGEHLIHDQIEDGLITAARSIGAEFGEYSVGAVFPAPGEVAGRHRYVVEFVGEVPCQDRLVRFVQALDSRLIAINEDYARRRANDIGLKAPELLAVAAGTCNEWLRRQGRSGGQRKVPRILNDGAQLASLVEVAQGWGSGARVVTLPELVSTNTL